MGVSVRERCHDIQKCTVLLKELIKFVWLNQTCILSGLGNSDAIKHNNNNKKK